MVDAAKKRIAPWVKNFPLWFRDHIKIGEDYMYEDQPTSLDGKMPHLGRITGKRKDRNPKPDHPVIRKLADAYEAATNQEFEQVNKLCGTNLEAAYDSVARFATIDPLYQHDDEVANVAMECLSEEFEPICRGSRVCSLHDAIQDSDLTRNAGLPWSRKYPNKEAVVLKERDFLQKVWDDFLPTGEYSFWIDWALKVEMRNVEKINQNKLRTIAMMSVDHVLFSKMMMLDVATKIIKAGYHRTGIAFGFNPFKGGMQRFAYYLGGLPGCSGWEFDVSKMDANLHQWIIFKIANMLFEFLRPEDKTAENRQRWHNLVSALCMCPVVLPDGSVWLKGCDGFGGNPSGQFLTSIFNSLYSKFLTYYGFVKLGGLRKKSIQKIRQLYRQHTRIAIVGDDLTYTTNVSWFNGASYGKLLYQDFGITLETPDESSQGRHWYKLGFLGFKFHWSEELQMIVFKLRPNNVYSSMLTIGKGELDLTTGLPKPWASLDRLCSLRLASWGDERVRALLRYVIDGFIEHYDTYLYDETGESPWELAKLKVFSDNTLGKLYSGYQFAETDELASSSAGSMASSWVRIQTYWD